MKVGVAVEPLKLKSLDMPPLEARPLNEREGKAISKHGLDHQVFLKLYGGVPMDLLRSFHCGLIVGQIRRWYIAGKSLLEGTIGIAMA